MWNPSLLSALQSIRNSFNPGSAQSMATTQKPTVDLAQANPVLQAALSKLANESDLNNFLGHLLMVCTDRFMAAEAGLWCYENAQARDHL